MQDIEEKQTELLVHRVYDYHSYTYHRMNRILKEHYGCKLEKIWQGYKANRKVGYKELYNIVTISDGMIVAERITLDRLRHVLANADYPLYDELSVTKEQ